MTAVDIALGGMDTGFAIVVRADCEPFGHELLAQLDIIDHIAVVSTDDVAVRVQVGLGIDLGGLAKGRPTKLGDAALTGHLGQVVFGSDFIHPTDVFAQVDLCAADGGRADRIVAAVGETTGSLDQDRAKGLFFVRNDAKYAAHKSPN